MTANLSFLGTVEPRPSAATGTGARNSARLYEAELAEADEEAAEVAETDAVAVPDAAADGDDPADADAHGAGVAEP
jgi:hypothetical protein